MTNRASEPAAGDEPVARVVRDGATVRLEWASVHAAHNAKPGSLYAERAAVPAIREALRELVAKLEQIQASPEYGGIWCFLEAHGVRYKGPNWADALDNARAALASPRPVTPPRD